MIASILEAPQQVRVSAPALPKKSNNKNYPELIKDVTLESIREIKFTKRNTLYIKYGTATGRGCSFVSLSKLFKAFADIQRQRRGWTLTVYSLIINGNGSILTFGITALEASGQQVISQTHVPTSRLSPHLVEWNNSRLISAEEAKASIIPPAAEHKPVSYDAWGAAQKELGQHIKQQGDAVVDMNQLRINREKRDLEAAAAKRKCAIASFEDSGDTIYQVKDESGKDLGYIAIDATGKVFYRSSKEGSKEQKVNGAVGAVRGLIDAQTFDRANFKSGIMYSKADDYRRVREYCKQVYGRR